MSLLVLILPPQYRSQTRLMLPPSPTAVLESEAELIRSQRILSIVVTNLGLAKRFAERHKVHQELPLEVVLALLKRQVEVMVHSNTRILETAVHSDDRLEASDIANEIAKVYLASLVARGINASGFGSLIETAVPVFRASRPNRPLAIASSVGIGLSLLLGGAWLFFMGLKSRATTRSN